MKVTIIADASHCTETGACGYGYWIASARGKFGDGGEFPTPLDTACAAEMFAICYAVTRAVEVFYIQPGDHVILQTDCQGAIDAFMSTRRKLSDDEKYAKGLFFLNKKDRGFTVSFLHIKGHSNNNDPRSVAQNLCDSQARQGMQLARQHLGGTNARD